MLGFLFKNAPPAKPAASKPQSDNAGNESPDVAFGLSADSAPDVETIDQLFIGLLLNSTDDPDETLKPDELQTLHSLTGLREQSVFPSKMVPRLPQVVPRIMKELRDGNSSADDLVKLITEDLTLVAEVIQLSNSAYYRTGEQIESLKQAVVKLGINGVRQLVASALFKPILSAGKSPRARVLGQYLWQKNQKAALAGNFIALHTGDDRFHAYLVGLLGQSGLMVAAKALEDANHFPSAPFSRHFLTEMELLSRQLSSKLSTQWEMPAPVSSALAELANFQHHGDLSALANACYVADKLAKISLLEFKGPLQDVDEGFICNIGTIRSKLCQSCYNFINLEELRERQERR